MRLHCLSTALLFSSVTFAQQSAPPKPAVVEGKVVGSLAGEPLRKVELTLSTSMGSDETDAMMAMFGGGDDDAAPANKPAPPPKPPKKTYSATTDAAGKFHIEAEAGDYFLSLKHTGFVDQNYKPEGK